MKPHSNLLFARLARWLAPVAWALALLAPVAPAHATPLTAADEKSVRAVVEGQLGAFARDDASKAFSYAAPNVREAVGTAANFMAMVRNSYPLVYRPASVAS